jgi:O-antigen/teichoic acid export membrane protein
LLARSLGAGDFGALYLATTVVTLLFLFVEWGGQNHVAAAVARDRRLAARLLGTGLVLRCALAAMVIAALPALAAVMRYDAAVRQALLLCGLRFVSLSMSALCGAILRGLERMRGQAFIAISASVMDAVALVAVLFLGGGFRGVLVAQAVSAACAVVFQLALLSRIGIGRLQVDRVAAAVLVGGGVSFLVLDVILRLQPYIDATFLERLAPREALGWYGAATRILGVMLIPSNTLAVSLYPTLARLWQDDREACGALVRSALRTVMQLGVLMSTGTVIFAPFVVRLVYGRTDYDAAGTDLRILAAYLFLVYTSIVIGSVLTATGRQWKWALSQGVCLAISIGLDPVLIPWTQARYGNGGIGVCLAVVGAEIVMVSLGLALLPRDLLDSSHPRTFLRSLPGAAAAAGVGVVLKDVALVGIPLSAATYFLALWIQGETDAGLLRLFLPSPVGEPRGGPGR